MNVNEFNAACDKLAVDLKANAQRAAELSLIAMQDVVGVDKIGNRLMNITKMQKFYTTYNSVGNFARRKALISWMKDIVPAIMVDEKTATITLSKHKSGKNDDGTYIINEDNLHVPFFDFEIEKTQQPFTIKRLAKMLEQLAKKAEDKGEDDETIAAAPSIKALAASLQQPAASSLLDTMAKKAA